MSENPRVETFCNAALPEASNNAKEVQKGSKRRPAFPELSTYVPVKVRDFLKGSGPKLRFACCNMERCFDGHWTTSLQTFCHKQKQQLPGNLAIRACSKSTKWDAALGVLGIMLREAVHDVISFNSAMRALQTRWRQVFFQLYSLPARRVHSDTISHNLAIGACKQLWPQASAALGAMRTVSADLFSSSEGILEGFQVSM